MAGQGRLDLYVVKIAAISQNLDIFYSNLRQTLAWSLAFYKGNFGHMIPFVT